MNYKFNKFTEILNVIKNSNKKIGIFSLSETTISNLTEEINVDFIIDINKDLWKTKFNNIPIVSPLDEIIDNSIIILWGNHVSSNFDQIKRFKDIDIYICTDKINKFFNINNNYFIGQDNNIDKKLYFKSIVDLIDIELHSYCNRTCWFCPNSFIDRRKNTNHIDLDIYKSILNSLKEIDYSKYISFNGYSEPLANELFYEKLLLASKYLPKATLHINTNTDYLNNQSLEDSYNNGLRSMYIQLYLFENEIFSKSLIEKKVKKLQKKLTNVEFKIQKETNDLIEYLCIYKDMKIKAYARNFRINGVNRGDIKVNEKEELRKVPCEVIFSQVIINSNAEVLPCCHIRSDYEKHKSYTYDTVNKSKSIFDIFFNKKAIQWRKHLFKFDKKFKSPCDTCTFELVDDNELNRSFVKVINKND